MINRLQLIRNIGLFDSVADGAHIPLTRVTLVYAENGRGKTTLAAILRSLATGDPIPIGERRRLAAQHTPHVVINCVGGPPDALFSSNAWNRTLPNMAIFDDVFVDQNVYSGLVVSPEHRQNLHELILGAQGIALNQHVQEAVARIEVHNSELRSNAAAIPVAARGTLTVDDFCALPPRTDIDAVILATERNLAAAHEQDPIRNTLPFDSLSLPAFDISSIDQILQEDLPALDAEAADRVQAHLAGLGQGGETWVAEGMRLMPQHDPEATTSTCPFCAQNLTGSLVINHYREYFSAAYANLKIRLSETIGTVTLTHGGNIPAAFERSVRIVAERRQFWSRFCDVPELSVDTAMIIHEWNIARDAISSALTQKQAAPLERTMLSPDARIAITAYEGHRQMISTLNETLQLANAMIRLVKEQAAAGNPTAITADLSRLKAVKERHTPTVAALCAGYLAEKAAKEQTEKQRDTARTALDHYRTTVFPGYQTAVNLYLQRFNAGFRVDSVASMNTRGGPACSYSVVINNTPVPISGGTPQQGEPSFRNILSAGDRNALALAFFFASLDNNPMLSDKIVVIDDPISSLDEHRSLTTVQEVRRLADQASQVIVLSHSKPFLCCIWEGTDASLRTAVEVIRSGGGSTLHVWDVNNDCVTEHDRRHALLREYVRSNTQNKREVARAIRPLLEAFIRVAYPEHFPPGRMLGSFHNLCEQRQGTQQQILNANDTRELHDLVEYANRFHHDTNQAWETESINDGQLLGFVTRALAFTQR